MASSNGTVTFPAPRGPQNDSGKRLQDRVPIDAITADARQARPGRAIQGVIGGFFFVLAWALAKSLAVTFLAGAWCFSAWKMGWRTARGEPLNQPDLEEVLAENQRLRNELARVS
jgi:hypothetical protein